MNSLLQDLRYALRILARAPGFTAVAILTLALGIGANTAIFSVVYGVLLRPLPYPKPGQIVQISISYKGQVDFSNFTAGEFHFWQQHSEPFAYLAATEGFGRSLTGSDEPIRIRVQRVSSTYCNVMGVQPVLGRNFTAQEDSPSGANVAILSYSLWKSRFAGDPSLIGKNVSLDGTPFTVVGIMPRGFANIPAADLWTTIAQADQSTGSGYNYDVIGRLKDGVSRRQADAYLSSVEPRFFAQFRTRISSAERADVSFHATPLVYMLAYNYHTPLLALFGAIGFVLLIACVNVANLLLARAATRSREMAVRTALGAGRARVIRQLLTETLLLACAGGALGLLIAYGGLNFLLSIAPPDLPRAQDIALDRWALVFTFVLSAGCGILFGLAPAFHGSKTNLNESLKESSGKSSPGSARQRVRSVLVVAEIGLSVILLAGAALLIETFSNLLRVNPGFDPHPLLAVEIWPTGEEIPSTDAMTSFHRQVIERIERMPGVQAAGIAVGGLPLEQGGNEYFTFVGQKRDGISADYREITPDYFRALAVPLLRGRFFTAGDSSASHGVAIVNEQMARNYFPGGNALGQHIKLEDQMDLDIVGVTGDIKSFVGQPAEPTVFIPDAQADVRETKGFLSWFPAVVIVRTAQNPLSINKRVIDAVHATDPLVPVGHVDSMEDVLSTSLAFQEFLMTLMSIFAGLAIVLAAVGIYGVMAYSVTQRTHEIGIRVSLGASPADIGRLVLSRGMLLTLGGIVAGLGGAYGLTRLLADQLFGVKPADPFVLAIAAVALALVALLACWIPARRATRIDPLVALRYE